MRHISGQWKNVPTNIGRWKRSRIERIDYQYILWRDFYEDKVKSYNLKTVTFGTVPAPYLATRVLVDIIVIVKIMKVEK